MKRRYVIEVDETPRGHRFTMWPGPHSSVSIYESGWDEGVFVPGNAPDALAVDGDEQADRSPVELFKRFTDDLWALARAIKRRNRDGRAERGRERESAAWEPGDPEPGTTNWRPLEVMEFSEDFRMAVTIDDHCIVVLVSRDEGWQPTSYLPLCALPAVERAAKVLAEQEDRFWAGINAARETMRQEGRDAPIGPAA